MTTCRREICLAFACLAFFLGSLFLRAVAIQAEPGDPVAMFRAGRFDEARAGFVTRLAERPDDPEALYYLGRLTPEGAKSQAYFERLLKAYPDHDLADDALLELAEVAYAGPSGRYIHARTLYRQLLTAYPDSPLTPRALYRIGTTFLVTRQPDSAVVAFRTILDRFPESAMIAYARLGIVEADVQKGHTEEALKGAEALLASDPGPLREDILRQVSSLRKALGRSDRYDGRARPSAEAPRFWVRVGAFRNVDNLRRLSARLNKAGFQTEEARTGTDGLHFLFAGPYSDGETADRARRRIETQEGITCKVVERP